MASLLLHVNMPLTLSNVTPLQEDKHFRETYPPCSESSFRLDAVSTLVSTLVSRPKKFMLSRSWSIQLNNTRACTLMPAKCDPRNECFRFRFRPSESADEDYGPIRTWG